MRRRVLTLATAVLAAAVAAVFLLDMIRPQHLVAGLLVILALAALWAAATWVNADRAGLAVTRDWNVTRAREPAALDREPGYARLDAKVGSYLHSRDQRDLLQPVVLALATDRLRERCGQVLGADAQADREALGPELHDYLTRPGPPPRERTAERLAVLVDALERI